MAHNCLLVEEPDESFVSGKWINDGGQRWPNVAREARTLEQVQTLGYRVAATSGVGMALDEGWAYLEGDLTEAYGAKKVESHRRAFVWLKKPADGVECALAVFDRLVTAKAGAVKRWLLHTAGEPVVSETGTVSENGKASLVHQVVLPVEGEFRIEKVGGPGSEFMAAGQNFEPDRAPVATDEAGSWRVEVVPSVERREEVLLNVMQVVAAPESAVAAHALSAGTHAGFVLGDRAVLFRVEAGPAEG